jgi:copper transport protein
VVDEAEQGTSALAGAVGDVGRWTTMVGALLAIGAFAFAATTLVGTPDEVRRSVRWIRRGSMLVIGGTILEVAAVAVATSATPGGALSATHILDAIGIQFGLAVLLRFVGAIAMLQDPRALVVSRGRPIIGIRRTPGSDVEPATADDQKVGTTIVETSQAYRVEVQHEWVMIAGMVAVVASFALDGHSVDTGFIGRIASMTHVVAGGVWFGGLVLMSDTLMRRWKAGVDPEAAFMAVRFSRVAAASLTIAAIAGVVLAWTIVDAPSEILMTAWGRLLVLKVALVAVVATIGAYNHFRVVPGISHDEGDRNATILRRTTRIESAILVGVLGVTAILVTAVV